MNKQSGNKKTSSGSGFLTGLLCTLGGIAVGVGAKLLYDEIKADTKQAIKNVDEKNNENEKTIANQSTQEEFNYPTTLSCNDIEYQSFVCPITQELMRDPVITPHGISFERNAILDWISKNPICPFTKKPLRKDDLITNYALKSSIQEYLKKISIKKEKVEDKNL
jgi:hypothetical protein